MSAQSSPQAPPQVSHRPTLTLPAPPITVADLESISLDDARVELVDGMWIVRPWPTPLHTRVTQRIERILAGVATDEVEIFTHGVGLQVNDLTELAPDIAVGAPGSGANRRLSQVPHLVVEVSEVANRRYDRTVKLDLYAEAGVPTYILVDPDVPAIKVWELVDGSYTLIGAAVGDEELTVTRPLPVVLVPSRLVKPPSTD